MERLGRYELLAELGRGAMGVVYKARDPRIDRLVAIKVIAPVEGLDPAQAEQRRERVQGGARAWKSRPRGLRSTTRQGVEPGSRAPVIGLRCAQS